MKPSHRRVLITAIVGGVILVVVAVMVCINQYQNHHYRKQYQHIFLLETLQWKIKHAVFLVCKEYRAEGNSKTSTKNSVVLDGAVITVVPGTGYPTADALGIGTAVRVLSGFVPTYSNPDTVFNFGSGVIPDCHVSYNPQKGIAAAVTLAC